MLDRFDLYELCAQAPLRDARFLRAIHGRDPRVLGEDFSGGGAIARQWVQVVPDGRAVAVDRDPEPLERMRGVKGITVVCDDVRNATHKVDIIADLNFSICEIHARKDLVAYLAHARSRLKKHGVFVADIYGGSDAYFTGRISQRKTAPSGEKVTYYWEQRHADALTGRVVNVMHFNVVPKTTGGKKARTIEVREAFIYNWRLWSVQELRELLLEAGFSAVHALWEKTDDDGDDTGVFYEPKRIDNQEKWWTFIVAER